MIFGRRPSNESRSRETHGTSGEQVKALITGAGRLIGSYVTELVLRAAHCVRALVHCRGNGSWGLLANMPPGLNG